MTEFEKIQIDMANNYVEELRSKIEEFERRFKYIPDVTFSLLSLYKSMHISLIKEGFKKLNVPKQ
jgi:hypothetical protein